MDNSVDRSETFGEKWTRYVTVLDRVKKLIAELKELEQDPVIRGLVARDPGGVTKSNNSVTDGNM